MTSQTNPDAPTSWEAGLARGSIVLELDESVLDSVQGEHTVLLDYERGEYYGLNAVATAVWQQLRARRQFPDIVAALTAEYDVADELARRDVAAFLADLRDRGVVRAHAS
ncbi:MAG TPA: PqqD family protein [Gemmatimonadaceae bacterium]|nr:PqqD family protein [Gemmatimonadaceae bacterium]